MLKDHYGHEIVVAQYTNSNGIAEHYSIECVDCWEVLAEDRMLDIPNQPLEMA